VNVGWVPTDHPALFNKFAQCGWSEAKLAKLEQLIGSITRTNRNPHPLSLAVADAIKSM
jgi:hypothetical protein